MRMERSPGADRPASHVFGDPPPAMEERQCIAYVSDKEYLFPTLLSALQARACALPQTDVCVLLSEPVASFGDLQPLLAKSGVSLIDAADALSDELGRLDRQHFQARISVSTMAKLVLPQILPEHYRQIIYLDGDTQITSSLQALESAWAPPGKFFAARDYTAIHDLLYHGRASSYFNAGVLKFNRDGWIGQEAFELFLNHPEACDGKHDQGALNHVCGSSLILMSNRWNFPKQFLHLVDPSSLSIIHYMAHPKPWHGTFFPWSAAESRVYSELRASHPLYASLFRGLSLERKLVYKYRSVRERVASRFDRARSSRSLPQLLEGDFAV